MNILNDDEKKKLAEDLSAQRKEALRLRLDYEILPTQASPSLILAELLKIRERVDRVEDILQKVGRIRHEYQQQYSTSKTIADLTFDDALVKTNFDQYATAAEKKARATQASLFQLRAANEAEEIFRLVDGYYRSIEIALKGLDGYRLDLHKILATTPFDSSLER